MELRRRVVDFVEDGHTHRAAAAQFRVSIKFVNEMVLLKRATASLEAKRQGNGGGHGKLAGISDWIRGRIKEKRDLTLDELVVELRDVQGVEAHRVSVWRHLRGLGLTHKKDLRAVEQKRPDVALARQVWIGRRQLFMRNMLTRLAFIDETSLKTNMAKTTGCAERGARLVDHAPFGHWQTQTFIAALRLSRRYCVSTAGQCMTGWTRLG